LAVKSYLLNAGIEEELLLGELGVACIIVGVTDLWNLTSSEITFSPAFGMLCEQLCVKSLGVS